MGDVLSLEELPWRVQTTARLGVIKSMNEAKLGFLFECARVSLVCAV